MTADSQRFQIHLSTAIGLILLIALLIHLNFAPFAVDLGRNRIVIRYGWPTPIGEYEPLARFLFNMLFAIGVSIFFYRACEACVERIRWLAIAGPRASQQASAAQSTLARLKAVTGRNAAIAPMKAESN